MERKPWVKNLYGNKQYDDSYTDQDFLKDLKKNYNLQAYSIKECLVNATNISQEITAVAVFLFIFHRLYIEDVKPENILVTSFATTGAGYLAYKAHHQNAGKVLKDIIEGVSVLFFGYLFSPLLHNLTDGISTDTIFTGTFIILSLHLLCHNYGIDGFLVSKTISLNCGIFASIFLASRLSTPLHAFSFLVMSTEIFVLKPLLFEKFWTPLLTAPIVFVASLCLAGISKVLLVSYLLILIFVNLACPLMFQKLNIHKCTIKGPWDEAPVITYENI